MEVEKSVLIKVFCELFEELYLDLRNIYPKNMDIKAGLTIIQQMKKFNPKLMISKYKESINDPFYDKIMKGDLEHFLNRNFYNDCKKVGYDKNGAIIQSDWIESLKTLYIEQDNENKKKLKKYFQNLSKICKMYYS